ncbi:MAG TPA: hypothetical protein VM265_09890 [Sphingomicrobium sp.]|nr:hypothetical protein [Sphingomicrobium sp.]
MSKPWTSSKPTVELRPSRIRRDPVPLAKPAEAAKNYWDPSEWETWTVVVGVLFFGLAISIIVIGFSEFTSR